MSNIEQKLPCEVVQDILPLYHDGVCSGASRKMVENHLQECRTCKTLLQEMDETEMDMALADETKEVLEHHAKRERTLAYKTAVVIAGLLLLPIVIALLMTLPGYSDLKTDAAIMASMLLVAGFTVVPLLSRGKKLAKTIVASTAALILLIFIVEMFFDHGNWITFGEIACSTMFGLSLVFAPFVVKQLDLPETLVNQKALLTVAWDTIWFYLMMVMFAIDNPIYTQDRLLTGLLCVALGWAIFCDYRYLPGNGWMKTAVLSLLVGIWGTIGNALGWVSVSVMTKAGETPLDLRGWILAITLGLAIVLFVIGLLRQKGQSKRIKA